MKKNFEVIRLIQQKGNYHVISDAALGITLGQYLGINPNIEKEQLLQWMILLAKEMKHIEMTKALSIYRYLNPFCIIIKENDSLALLNLKSMANQKRVDKLLKNEEIKKFFKEEELSNDIYSFGKTLQYVLAKSNLNPKLTKKEEKHFQKIISKCLNANPKRAYQSFEQVYQDILSIQQQCSHINSDVNFNPRKNIRKRVLAILALFLWMIAVIKIYFFEEEVMYDANDSAYLEAGITYFATLDDYGKSEDLFSYAKNSKAARYYEELAIYMQGESKKCDKEIEEIVNVLEGTKENMSYEERYSLLKVYEKIRTNSAKERVRALAEEILESPDWYKNEEEVRQILAQSK